MKYSLSKFFPKNTEYFYSFPIGEESGFFNNVPVAWKDEIISARPLACSGDNIKVIVFDSTQDETVIKLHEILGSKLTKKENIIVLPEKINYLVFGKRKNKMIKRALKTIASKGNLVMAQPFHDNDLQKYFKIPTETSIWLNDKKNMPEYIQSEYLPKRYKYFLTGQDFLNDLEEAIIPCVVKVSSSASGDGVRICHNIKDYKKAQKEFTKIKNLIFIEEYINSIHNIGVQFGIPFQKNKPIEIIGFNEQMISSKGSYIGAMISKDSKVPQLENIYSILLNDILKKIRAKGWYGVGGFDVLINEDGGFYFIDANLRMTAATAYLLKKKNKEFKHSLLSFTGTFNGGEQDFIDSVVPIAQVGKRGQAMQIIALMRKGSNYYFNAALFYDSYKDLINNIEKVKKAGVHSKVLTNYIKEKNVKYE